MQGQHAQGQVRQTDQEPWQEWSIQNEMGWRTSMATIRDKMGHWPSIPLRYGGNVEFAFSLIMRTHRLRRQGAATPHISPKTGFFRVFCRLPVVCLVLTESESSSELPPDYELPTAISRAGEMGDGSALVNRSQPESRLAKLCRVGL